LQAVVTKGRASTDTEIGVLKGIDWGKQQEGNSIAIKHSKDNIVGSMGVSKKNKLKDDEMQCDGESREKKDSDRP
jgi:hypothetical protein